MSQLLKLLISKIRAAQRRILHQIATKQKNQNSQFKKKQRKSKHSSILLKCRIPNKVEMKMPQNLMDYAHQS